MDINYLKSLSYKILSNATSFSFNKTVLKIFAAIWLYLVDVKIYFAGVFVLVIIDCITGVIAAIRKGESFTSKILRKGLIDKFVLYVLMLIGVLVLEVLVKTIFNYTSYYFVFVATFLISSYELVSIFENAYAINPNLTFIQPLITLVKKLQSKAINKVTKEVNDKI